MTRKDPGDDRIPETTAEPRDEDRDAPDRAAAPPIEREHETQAGALEEDERRRRERR